MSRFWTKFADLFTNANRRIRHKLSLTEGMIEEHAGQLDERIFHKLQELSLDSSYTEEELK